MQTQISARTPQGVQVTGFLHIGKLDTCVLIVPGHNTTGTRPRYIELAKILQEHKYSACRMNITRKTSDAGVEVPTVSEEIQQVHALVLKLKERFKRIIVAGHSQGWISALQMCHDKAADGAVCIMGVVNTDAQAKIKLASLGLTYDQLGFDGYARMEVQGVEFVYTQEFFTDFQSFDIPSLIASTRTPLLFIFGTQDAIIPPAEVMKGFEIANKPKELFAIEAVHRFENASAAEIGRKIADWITQTIR